MSDAYLRRLITAAHDLAGFDLEMSVRRSQVDWSKCLDLADDGEGHPLTCAQQSDISDDLFFTKPPCAECEANRYIVEQRAIAKRKRYLAMRRVIRCSAHVSHRGAL